MNRVSTEQNKQNRVEVNYEFGDLCPSVFCRSSTLQHSAVGPFGLTEFPVCSIGCIDNLILSPQLSFIYTYTFTYTYFYTQAVLSWKLRIQLQFCIIFIQLADVHHMPGFVFKMSSLSQDLFVMVKSRCAGYQAGDTSQHPKVFSCTQWSFNG